MADKALSYLRLSGKGQIQGDGFPRQREAIERYAKAHGVELVGEYTDEGVSGTRRATGSLNSWRAFAATESVWCSSSGPIASRATSSWAS